MSVRTMVWCLCWVSLTVCSCGLTATEAACVATVETEEMDALRACGPDVSGPCSTDAIGERYDAEVARRCFP